LLLLLLLENFVNVISDNSTEELLIASGFKGSIAKHAAAAGVRRPTSDNLHPIQSAPQRQYNNLKLLWLSLWTFVVL